MESIKEAKNKWTDSKKIEDKRLERIIENTEVVARTSQGSTEGSRIRKEVRLCSIHFCGRDGKDRKIGI